jgi:hypothetical protein
LGYYSGTEEYTLTSRGKDGESTSKLSFKRAVDQGQTVYMVRSESGDETRTVVLGVTMRPIRAFSEKDGKIRTEITYDEKNAVIKEGGRLVKRVGLPASGRYLQREALEMVFRGYDFVHAPIESYRVIALDHSVYNLELSLAGKETVHTANGDVECYKLMLRPDGVGKIFAAKYRNFYLYTVKEPHQFVAYYNQFMPLRNEVRDYRRVTP